MDAIETTYASHPPPAIKKEAFSGLPVCLIGNEKMRVVDLP
jgi:hypothetical protein